METIDCAASRALFTFDVSNHWNVPFISRSDSIAASENVLMKISSPPSIDPRSPFWWWWFCCSYFSSCTKQWRCRLHGNISACQNNCLPSTSAWNWSSWPTCSCRFSSGPSFLSRCADRVWWFPLVCVATWKRLIALRHGRCLHSMSQIRVGLGLGYILWNMRRAMLYLLAPSCFANERHARKPCDGWHSFHMLCSCSLTVIGVRQVLSYFRTCMCIFGHACVCCLCMCRTSS